MPYSLTVKADADLERLYEWGLEVHGRADADSYFDGLIERFSLIAKAPLQWQAVDHIRSGYRRSVYHVHSIYYRILSDGSVEIARILRSEDLLKLISND